MAEIRETITIINKLGLHARPAALLVQTASKFDAKIEIENDSVKANGKSIMGVMMLAAACGTDIIVTATGDDAEEAVAGIRALIASKFDED